MKYWIDGIDQPMTREQIHEQRSRYSPRTRCAVVGTNEWRPILEVIPDLFDAIPQSVSPSESTKPSEAPAMFSLQSGWPVFFYVLAALNAAGGVIIAVFVNPVIGILAGLSSCLSCMFFAFVSQVLVDIRWLLSRNKN